jgi:ribosomal protein S18 acetylase RimI-like enzyme
MPEIQIRPVIEEDIPILIKINHSYRTQFVWQMDLNQDGGQIFINFREIRLPRPINVEYPRYPSQLLGDWRDRSALLIAQLNDDVVGYISLSDKKSPTSTWVTDLVVSTTYRRKGIGSALLMAGEEWAGKRNNRRIIIEMQSKNTPAIKMAMKMGFEFSGYNDHYYSNQDIALFFSQLFKPTI